MNRRGLLAGLATVATATLLPAAVPAHAEPAMAGHGLTLTAGGELVQGGHRVTRPCPVWCEEDHGPDAYKAGLERDLGERWHSACLGRGEGDVCVHLIRVDKLLTSESVGEQVAIHVDEDLTGADALLVSRILVASVDILAGRMTVDQWRSTSGVDHCRSNRAA
ncbi:hypothetical protein AB0I89_32165 [Micromonospora sp. NPDC049801]|uniref:hypothetical protein n=1 Tax=unclassified Micromonospora TaxID=2617518 RepID=UPI0033E68ECF